MIQIAEKLFAIWIIRMFKMINARNIGSNEDKDPFFVYTQMLNGSLTVLPISLHEATDQSSECASKSVLH